jgi:beta-N-acetylhexosaminidase
MMLLIGIEGTALAPHEVDWLRDPRVSGVILFRRNFTSREQIAALVEEIRATRAEPMLIAVDQEGGPVQRFREGFTPLPALARIGERYRVDASAAVELAEMHAWLMATELRAVDIDLSFAPVLDLARGNRAIGERAFDADPAVVAELGGAYLRGMRLAGMAATVKHFPGHGSVLEDTHDDDAVDPRPLEVIRAEDLVPFAHAFEIGAEAVMMAHVRYPAVAPEPAGYSPRWIRDILRGEMGFRGVVFSDDIGMAAARSAGSVAARIDAHLDAGCDVVLVCHPDLVPDSLAAVRDRAPAAPDRLAALRGLIAPTWEALVDNPQRDAFIARVVALDAAPETQT